MTRDEYDKQIRRRFRGNKILYSKYEPKIPAQAEREYIRLADQYVRLVKEVLEENMPELKKIYKQNLIDDDAYRQGYRADSATGLMLAINQLFQKMNNGLTTKMQGFGLRKRLENLGNLTRKLTINEWKKAVKATIGIDIREDHYLGDFYQENLEQWISDNVDLIKTIPQSALDDMKQIVYDGFDKGSSTTNMISAMQARYNISKRHAKFIARDQTAKLNAGIQKAQQTDAGVTMYEWSTSGDERVRESHRELNGKVFSWNDPPENADGRRCHPGEDYNCRCCALPVFDKETLNLPIDGTEMTGASAITSGSTEIYEPAEVVNTERQKEPSVENASSIASNAIIEQYDHRINDLGQKFVSPSEWDEETRRNLANLDGMDKRLAESTAEQFKKLSSEYNSMCNKIEVTSFDPLMATVPASTLPQMNVQQATISFNKKIMKNYDSFMERMQKAVNNGHFPMMTEKEYEKYVVTHEFAHTLMDFGSPLKNYVGAETKQIKAARKEIKAIRDAYNARIRSLTIAKKEADLKAIYSIDENDWQEARQLSEELRKVRISEYADMSVDEFMAEAFADAKIGSEPSEYSIQVAKVIDKYFKR